MNNAISFFVFMFQEFLNNIEKARFMDKVCYLHLCLKYSKHPCFQSGNPCESVVIHFFASSYESVFESKTIFWIIPCFSLDYKPWKLDF